MQRDSVSRFTDFIDQYILLLALRFGASLEVDVADEVEELEQWKNVALCVQDVLRHPKTEEERCALRHVDVDNFNAHVCRGRAMYLQWESWRRIDGLSQDKAVGCHTQISSPSAFDITRDSLHDEVQRIYASARARLPSTFSSRESAIALANNGDFLDSLRATKSDTMALAGSASESSSSAGDIEVVDVPLPSEEDARRNRVFAEARDALLTKVQEMQSEFFAKYRRWVDVPFDFDFISFDGKSGDEMSVGCSGRGTTGRGAGSEVDLPPEKAATESKAAAHVGRSTAFNGMSHVPLPGAPDDSRRANASDAVSALFEALRCEVNVSRPPRPSQMREEDYCARYADMSAQCKSGVPPKTQSPKSQCPHPHGDNTVCTLNTLPTRLNRWSVVEYEGENSNGEEEEEEEGSRVEGIDSDNDSDNL
ncbi:hypothetical protein TRVL_00440 [Trypanosoma vivax]|uniref:Uncharacterized protein n=1 Tax=Trypanosoma vivax (strain Y486) TaxID=1055687 RepID=G0U6G8_TRYVY|nr:hypothetical protein TRVL_00440 [Trypanosoma vivax]CCC51472.1 conserved hypothetical protein [Trypanosoma vivax Y486]